jgi:hypothetical protein
VSRFERPPTARLLCRAAPRASDAQLCKSSASDACVQTTVGGYRKLVSDFPNSHHDAARRPKYSENNQRVYKRDDELVLWSG